MSSCLTSGSDGGLKFWLQNYNKVLDYAKKLQEKVQIVVRTALF